MTLDEWVGVLELFEKVAPMQLISHDPEGACESLLALRCVRR